ncbi:MAG: flagellar motor switch protein FliM [candidate division Zixibacteria bacterium 4484_95]|nr:MAG: flagellar motor switch protein FliM [candidate division Zixibacteria bacterium 4484_95]RKX17066.1 MAG: flagellar motor switch protein FliM [candidate division Zixibacteria bacterium]
MAKILSQDEIDDLLSNVATNGEGSELLEKASAKADILGKAVAYDFKHPNRLSKDQMRTLESLHSNFAGHFRSALSGITRSVVDVDLLSVDQITYSEFIMSLMSPSCTYVFTLSPLDGVGIMDFNPSVVFAFVDRMFGGVGKTLNAERELTGIEKSIMKKIVSRSFKELEKTWESILPVNIKQSAFESNPQFIQVVPQGETVIVISLQLKMMSSSGIMTICYPYLTLEGVVEKLSAQKSMDKNKKIVDKDNRLMNAKRLVPVQTYVKTVLGNTTLTVRDLINIKAGDVIKLDQRIYQDVDVYVGDKLKFHGKPGLSGNQLAVKITNYH